MSAHILLAQVKHETNTFSRLLTDLDSYKSRFLLYGDEIAAKLGKTRTEMAGFLDAARNYGWTTTSAIAADATPSGMVTAECWAHLQDTIFKSIDSAPKIDGVLLSLHGAMVAQGADDAEGDLLARLRARLGPDMPIFATLDLHANVSDAMARHANGLISYRTYPHIDHYERATQAADLMARTLAGKIKPRCLVARRPTIAGCNHGRTQSGPMADFLQQADAFETEKGILVVSVQAGFGWADMQDCGPSIAVTYDGDKARAQQIADDLMDQVWETRHIDSLPLTPLAAAMAEAKRHGPKPLILADTTDNPGGGGYNDATGLLRAMLDAKLENACCHAICDPEAIAVINRAGVGTEIHVKLGGKIDPDYGAPIDLTARVVSLCDGKFVADGPMNKGVAFNHGPSAVLRAGGIDIVVVSHRLQTADLQALLSVGIDPRAKATIGLKSSHHFRAAYEPISRQVMLVDSGALCSHDLTRFKFPKVRRPVWPLDEMT